MAMKDITVLKRARAKIADPKRWTRFVRFDGKAYCALGAIDAALGSRAACDEHSATAFLAGVLTKKEREKEPPDNQRYHSLAGEVARFNNASTHKQVLHLFDRAIKKLSAS